VGGRPAVGPVTAEEELAAWAASGAMFLTGRRDGPPLPAPGGFVARLRAIGGVLHRTSAALGRAVDVDVLALLGERAALAGLRRGGDTSCGGAARLLPTADGWLAVNLPRPGDVDLLPAWLAPVPIAAEGRGAGAIWTALASAIAGGSANALAGRAQLLGLPVAALPRRPPAVPHGVGPFRGLPVAATPFGEHGTGAMPEGLVVVDLSSLWAGPLCSHLLQMAGARVVKVESRHRPDGARFGSPEFFDLLHAGQRAVALDFRTEDGRAALRRLLRSADVVVEGSRPRALEQLGIGAGEILAEAAGGGAGPRVWVSVTGYGRTGPGRERVAFGDDGAVAGGLVAGDAAGPCFLADAVADPCAGLVAAAAVFAALGAGGRWLLDVSLASVAAHLAGRGPRPAAARPPTTPAGVAAGVVAGVAAGVVAVPPRARPAAGRAPALGEHTDAVLAGTAFQ